MIISLLSDFESRYASRISEYVIPPATNTSIRWRVSLCVFPPRAALCQLGFWLRRETAGWIAGLDRRLLAAGAADGESFTYGNSVGSSLLETCSCASERQVRRAAHEQGLSSYLQHRSQHGLVS